MAGISRRDAIKVALGWAAASAAVGSYAGAAIGPAAATRPASATTRPAKAKAVIQVWLWGGPCHVDTFDPKPEAGAEICGPLISPIATNVSGIRIGELLPLLAKHADKYSLIRGMTHGNNGHETAAYLVQTGHAPGGDLVFPSVGAVVNLFKGVGAGYKGLLPPYVVLTEPQGRFSEAGFLGSRYKPFATGGDPARTPFVVEGVVAQGVTRERQLARRSLMDQLDTLGRATGGDEPQLTALAASKEEAYDLILGDGGTVFDLARESDAVRDAYGRDTFGQSCLLARRLVERGVPYVTINSKGWDTHKQHFQIMRQKLPQLDRGLATLLKDLGERSLLPSTIVWCGGEFGRTPRVQWEAPWNGGRGHHGAVFSTLVAGGGFRGGQVVGASDARGERLKDRAVYPADLIGSMYELLGIDPDAQLPHPQGRLVRAVPPPAVGSAPSGGRLKEIM